MNTDAENRLLSASIRVRSASPFFGTLILFAESRGSMDIETAATDGAKIFYNPAYILGLSPDNVAAVLLHEVLHCAFLHVQRRGTREPQRWNVAADIVVNGIIATESAFSLPQGSLRDETLQHMAVEEVYDLLPPESTLSISLADLSPEAGVEDSSATDIASFAREHWRTALRSAEIIARTAGRMPAGLSRELGETGSQQIDWRARLWQFMVTTPTDFAGFDRRFLWQRIYLDGMCEEKVVVDVAVDTSGSVDNEELAVFTAELRGILRAYPRIECRLFYADAALYGPWSIASIEPLPPPQGGGGTSFRPFFDFVAADRRANLCIYLTDGYGEFPEKFCRVPVLWVVTPGGLDNDEFPFGTVLRLRRC